jgi:hypothetical protein
MSNSKRSRRHYTGEQVGRGLPYEAALALSLVSSCAESQPAGNAQRLRALSLLVARPCRSPAGLR